MPEAPRGPLDGFKVVELSTTLLGPYCGLLLAELGAEVIKVESPTGDVNRHLLDGRNDAMSPQFLNFNFGKRSVVLDLANEAARGALDRVLAGADVFFHNSRTATVRKLGLSPERIREVRPDIVHCSLVGFGDASPMAGRPAYDDAIQALSGLSALQGLSQAPQYVVTTICDKLVAWAGVAAICAALARRATTGQGETIEVPMFELMAGFTLHEQLGNWTYDPPLGPIGYPRTLSAQRRPYRALDGYISVTLITEAQWIAFFDLNGASEVLDHASFATPGGRTANIGELLEAVEASVAQRTVAEWLDVLAAAEIPVAPIRSLEEVVGDDYLNAAGVFEMTEHPTEGPIRRVRQAIGFAGAGTGARTGAGTGAERVPLRHAPRLGEHTLEVLREAGVADDQLAELGLA